MRTASTIIVAASPIVTALIPSMPAVPVVTAVTVAMRAAVEALRASMMFVMAVLVIALAVRPAMAIVEVMITMAAKVGGYRPERDVQAGYHRVCMCR
jgi:hypothetical protein